MIIHILFLILYLIFTGFVFLGIFWFFTLAAMVSGAPYVPTSKSHVREMVALAGVRPGELVIDLGSGDGRLLIESVRLGARGIGWEINPLLYFWSKFKIKQAGFQDKIKINYGSFWKADISRADVIVLFLITHKMKKMKNKLQTELKPGTRVVSNGFKFPDWEIINGNGAVYLYKI
ncbi:MAG TPA: 50S ribosomal protein L11 methyltransferase [Patescibacteria group bacterium]